MGLSYFNILLIIIVVGIAGLSIYWLARSSNKDRRSFAGTYLATFFAVVLGIPFTLFIDDLAEYEKKSADESSLLCAVNRTIDTNEIVLKALSTAIQEGRVSYDNLDSGFLESVASIAYETISHKDIKWIVDDFRYRFASLQTKLLIQQDLTGLNGSPQSAYVFNENRKLILPIIQTEVITLLGNIDAYRNRIKTNYPKLVCPPFTMLPKSTFEIQDQ